MPIRSILIVLGDHAWTVQAMHLACAMARDNGAVVFIVKMLRVNHPLLLGDVAGYVNYTASDRTALQECAATAEDYGVSFREHVCTYADYAAAVAGVAEQLDAAVVLAPPYHSHLPALNRFAAWRLRRIVGRPLFCLSSPTDQPAVALGPATVTSGAAPLPVARPSRS